MKILVISNLFPPGFMGGYELGCSQMVETLATAGHDVRVVTSVGHANDTERQPDVKRILALAPIYNSSRMASAAPELQRYYHLLSTTVNPANLAGLSNTIEDFAPDVAYLWNLLGIGGVGILALLSHLGIPWVWHLMDSIPRQVTGFLTSGPGVARELANVFPGHYIACSRHVVGEIRAGNVELGENVRILPNWVYGIPPQPRSEFYSGGELKLLTASGELSEPKGTHILIEAASRLLDLGFTNFSIDIYGNDHDSRFRAMALERSIGDHVRFSGPREHRDLLRAYSSYDVFAFPTWAREPFAFAPLEAAGAGCVPLLSDDCGNAEWMIDGVDCLKARRSSDDFANRVAQVLMGDLDLAQLGRRAQRTVWRDFHISQVAASVMDILRGAADDQKRPRGRASEFLGLAIFAEGLIQTLLDEAQN